MSIRVSSYQMTNDLIAQMNSQQASLNKTETQVASGQAMQSPSDNPIAATQVMTMTSALSQLGQYTTNQSAATTRLNYSEQAFSDITNLLQSMRTYVVQANSGVLSATEQSTLATAVSSGLQQLSTIANQQDANGEYVFSGTSTTTQPFTQNASGGYSYAGNQSTRSIQIGSNNSVVDGFSGAQVFQNIPQGNGTFTLSASSANTGSSTAVPGTVTNAAAWVPGTYNLQFTSPTAWQVVDSSNNVVASGAYTSGNPISFNGAQITVSGTPATGDSYAIAPAGTESMFTTLSNLASALGSANNSSAAKAQLTTTLNASLGQIDNALNTMTGLTAQVGSRLNAVTSAGTDNQSLSASLTATMGQLTNVDYATAISKMNQQMVGLQAAQQAYVKISGLSLFNYLG